MPVWRTRRARPDWRRWPTCSLTRMLPTGRLIGSSGACDNWAAVCAQIGAAHDVTSGVADGSVERCGHRCANGSQGRRGVRRGLDLVSVGAPDLFAHRAGRDPDALRRRSTPNSAAMLAGCGAMSVDTGRERRRRVGAAPRPVCGAAQPRRRSAAHQVDVHVDDATGPGYLERQVAVTDAHAVDTPCRGVGRHGVRSGSPYPRSASRCGAGGDGRSAGTGCRVCASNPTAPRPHHAVGGVVIHVITRAQSLEDPAADTARHRSHPATPDPEPDGRRRHSPNPTPEHRPRGLRPASEPGPAAPAVGDAVAQRRALLGGAPPLLPKPWYTYNWAGLLAALNAERRRVPAAPPAVILGGPVMPAALVDLAAMHATITAR